MNKKSWKRWLETTNPKKRMKEEKPLIHCLMNAISMNDCANLVLALGGSPIMAEHPEEVEEIVQVSDALVCNLGNISDLKMKSIMKAGVRAKEKNIFRVLDLVGCGCSRLRLDFARQCTESFSPSLIKGNLSEIRAFLGVESHARGIDAGKEEADQEKFGEYLLAVSKKSPCMFLVTGAVDWLVWNGRILRIGSGCEKMSGLTGTGCMLGVAVALFCAKFPGEERFYAAAYAVGTFGVMGEEAFQNAGPGTAHQRLFDMAEAISDEKIKERLKVW